MKIFLSSYPVYEKYGMLNFDPNGKGEDELKKPLWKRINRGFWVSMILVAAVAVYVLISQLMLIPQQREIRALAKSVAELWQESTLLTDEQIASLRTPDGNAAETARVKKSLEALFLPDSDYLDAGIQTMLQEQKERAGGEERVRARRPIRTQVQTLNIVEDTATAAITYHYKSDGDFFQYDGSVPDGGRLQSVQNVNEDMAVYMLCKRVNGQWKIFRIGSIESYTYSTEAEDEFYE